MKKTLNENMKTNSEILGMNNISCQHREFFHTKDYEWWYKVQPGDVVVDIGACIGMFTCLALDFGAKKVYSVEPNADLLKDAMYNAFDHIVDKRDSPVIPVNKAIGDPHNKKSVVFGQNAQEEYITFKDFISEYNINYIDYLKIDCEGGEYDIFTEENINFLVNNVKHIAVEFHLLGQQNRLDFLNFRNNYLKLFDHDKVKFMDASLGKKIHDNNFINGGNHVFMMYFCNKSL